MKTQTLFFLMVLLLLLASVSVGYAYVADYSLPWWTVDAGGGSSDSDSYALSGTIGQSNAGIMTGGAYILAEGFWGGGLSPVKQLYLPIITR